VAEPDVVVTNAHVVAGEQDTTVEVGGHSPDLPARPIAFDPADDVAILQVSGLEEPSLGLVSDPASGRPGVILGYPENGPLNAQPGRIGRTQSVLTQDAYGRGLVSRLLTPVRGLVRPGNSGGPLVDAEGHVLTTVFASTLGGGPHSGYGIANATVASVLAGGRATASQGRQVSTGPCAAG
jgi:S1-C subfamily serine protease